MNLQKLRRSWFPLLPANQLTDKPQAVLLLGEKLVLTRLNGKTVCFADCCPHRHVPLSRGSVSDGLLQCCYHGWQFDETGRLKNLPGCIGSLPDNADLTSYACTEYDGWIWVSLNPSQAFAPYADFSTPTGFDSINRIKSITADFIHAIENFLDPTHTPYIHKGLLRSNGPQSMEITQNHSANGFTTLYKLKQQQNGLINRLFDRGININEARFTYPGLAVIDYRKDDALLYRVALFFVPQDNSRVGLAVRVSIPRTAFPSSLKFLMLRPFLEALLHQDKTILEIQYRNSRFPQTPYTLVNSDLVIDHLLHLLADAPEGHNKSGTMTLHR